MPEIREVYEMITREKPSEPGALERQQRRQVRAARNRRVGGYAVAAAIGLVAGAGLILGTRAGRNATTPGEEPPVPGITSVPFLLDISRGSFDTAILSQSGPSDLFRAGERTPLPENLAGGFNYAASPDGTRLVYGTGHGGCEGNEVVTIANIDGTDAHMLESPEGLNICGARWSPDGTKLVYQERNGEDPYDVGNLFVHELSRGRRTQLTDLQLTRAWWWFLSPRFTPNGKNVIFHMPRDSSETTEWDAWSVPITGGEPRLMLRSASFPMMIPRGVDGATAFVSPWPDEFAGRSVMTGLPFRDLGLGTLVEADRSIWWPTMAPDGSKLAYEDGGSIYVADLRLLAGEYSKVAEGGTAEWLDNDTLIVTP